MIGDWVLTDVNAWIDDEYDPRCLVKNYQPYRIETGEDLDCLVDDDSEPKPIYLTLEHILANGFAETDTFVKDRRIFSFRDTHFQTFYLTDYNCINGGLDWVVLRDGKVVVITNLRYVHELQHAMRLMSMQETADNFNIKF